MSNASDKAFEEWFAGLGTHNQAARKASFHIAFEAGWQARKRSQYAILVSGKEPALFGPWVQPRDNPKSKLFDPTSKKDSEDGC